MKNTFTSTRNLQDNITCSDVCEFGSCITDQDMHILQKYIPQLYRIIQTINNFSKIPGTTLNILDYDDTLHQRSYQLQSGLLQDNRGIDGNKIIDERIGRDNFLDTYYKHDSIVHDLSTILYMQDRYHAATIVTAGEYSWQKSKIQHTGLYHNTHTLDIVPDAKLKIQSIIKKIIQLGYIPEKIIIYDDKPSHFKQASEALSKFLGGTKIIVNHIVLSQQEIIKRKIADIFQCIYTIQD